MNIRDNLSPRATNQLDQSTSISEVCRVPTPLENVEILFSQGSTEPDESYTYLHDCLSEVTRECVG